MVSLASQVFIATCLSMSGMNVADDPQSAEESVLEPLTGPRVVREVPSWNARFVQHCGYWSCYDHRAKESAWPFPSGLTLRELTEFAEAQGVLCETPEPGDLYVTYSPVERTFVHTGAVVDIEGSGRMDGRQYFDLYTVEADINRDGERGGGRTMRTHRRVWPGNGDRFIRWSDLVREEQLGVARIRSVS